jgi:hypothetical protein
MSLVRLHNPNRAESADKGKRLACFAWADVGGCMRLENQPRQDKPRKTRVCDLIADALFALAPDDMRL